MQFLAYWLNITLTFSGNLELLDESDDLFPDNFSSNARMTSNGTGEHYVSAIAKSLAISTMMIFAVAGNMLVVLSVCVFKKLRTFTNMLLVSMATADCLIGLLIMPFAMLYLVHDGWFLGSLMCKIWLTLDVLLCTASILNLCVISIDRYFAILYPLKYLRRRTRELSFLLTLGTWILSALICTPPWFVSSWGFSENPGSCEYVPILSYRIYSALGSFYVPTFVILFVYYRILKVASTREKLNQQRNQSGRSSVRSLALHSTSLKESRKVKFTFPNKACSSLGSVGCEGQSPATPRSTRSEAGNDSFRSDNFRGADGFLSSIRPRLARGGPRPNQRRRNSAAKAWVDEVEVSTRHVVPNDETTCYIAHDGGSDGSIFDATIHDDNHDVHVSSSLRSADHQSSLVNTAKRYYQNSKAGAKRVKNAYQRERKALKTIGVIVVGFVFCWLPFFLLYLLQSAKPDLVVPPQVEHVFLWLGYSNSVLNPAIYTFYNIDFRRAFLELIMCGCWKPPANRRYSVRHLHSRPTH